MDAIERLTNAGLEELVLPSGIKVRGVLPTIKDLYLRELVPDDLRAVVAKFSMGVSLQGIPAEERPLYFRYVRLLVAAFFRDVWNDQAWQPVSLTIDDTFRMNVDDIDAIEDVVLRRKAASQVTAEGQLLRGELGEEEARAVIDAAAAQTLGGWATFRHFFAWVADSAGRGDVPPPAEPAAGPNRAARRSRARRSAGVAAST